MDKPYLEQIPRKSEKMKNFIFSSSLGIFRDHLTDSQAVCFRIVFVLKSQIR